MAEKSNCELPGENESLVGESNQDGVSHPQKAASPDEPMPVVQPGDSLDSEADCWVSCLAVRIPLPDGDAWIFGAIDGDDEQAWESLYFGDEEEAQGDDWGDCPGRAPWEVSSLEFLEDVIF